MRAYTFHLLKAWTFSQVKNNVQQLQVIILAGNLCLYMHLNFFSKVNPMNMRDHTALEILSPGVVGKVVVTTETKTEIINIIF